MLPTLGQQPGRKMHAMVWVVYPCQGQDKRPDRGTSRSVMKAQYSTITLLLMAWGHK
jgi:hypothetical protein